MSRIEVDLEVEGSRRLWKAVGDLADVLGQARPPGALTAIDEALRREGFQPAGPDLDGVAHRYQRGGLIVDLLAPDGLNPAPDLGGGLKAVGVPGGSQALNRSEVVTVIVEGEEFTVRRPTLLGAILIKARSITRHVDPESQREDLLRLLALVEDPRTMARDLKTTERTWLRQAEDRLDLDGVTRLDDATVRNARFAYRILVRQS